MMSLLGCIAWKLTRLTNLVPYNPCTIFGRAALFAGSRLCRHDMADLLPSNERPGREKMYRLDWWEESPEVNHQVAGNIIAQSVGNEAPRKRRRYGIDIVDAQD